MDESNMINKLIKKLNIKLFLIFFLLFFGCILVKLVANSNEYNLVDNRRSYKFEKPSFKTIISGEFQSNVENAISDQMPKYNWFKLAYSKVSNFLNLETIYFFKFDKIPKYIKIGTVNLYKGYLLYNTTTNDGFINTSKNDIQEINNIIKNVDANVYLYFVNTDSNINFETNYKVDSISYLKKALLINKNNISSYDIQNFDDYKGYFYKTDHHWNYKGSYKGYLEIANLMKFDNVLKYNDKICFDKAISSGSKTKSIGDNRYFRDRMCIYTFDFPNFEIIANNVIIDSYGNTVEELNKKTELSYGALYGGDFAELIFKNLDSTNNKKLLIYANSYSNAINKLLASNYSETYVIDGRHFKDFDMIEYVKKNNVDDILILANCMLFWDDIKW